MPSPSVPSLVNPAAAPGGLPRGEVARWSDPVPRIPADREAAEPFRRPPVGRQRLAALRPGPQLFDHHVRRNRVAVAGRQVDAHFTLLDAVRTHLAGAAVPLAAAAAEGQGG